ncbi:NADH dehydrogenase 1 alpha subcomplex subunit 12 ndufa12/DAP13 [Linderina pennispora]|nr:NADH dehydrogenase 1 alpha subcomplex subunit 12 ndufa12/DAP13 [Linderina pennispora]
MSLARFIKFSLKNSPRQNFEIYRKLDDAKWGTHVGTDELGNRYFMNPTERYGRERWVIPAGRAVDVDASRIPPRWRGWLHKVTDEIPKATAEEDAKYLCRPKWMASPHYENYTGTRKAYVTYNTVKPKYESWEPAVAPRQ